MRLLTVILIRTLGQVVLGIYYLFNPRDVVPQLRKEPLTAPWDAQCKQCQRPLLPDRDGIELPSGDWLHRACALDRANTIEGWRILGLVVLVGLTIWGNYAYTRAREAADHKARMEAIPVTDSDRAMKAINHYFNESPQFAHRQRPNIQGIGPLFLNSEGNYEVEVNYRLGREEPVVRLFVLDKALTYVMANREIVGDATSPADPAPEAEAAPDGKPAP